MSFDTTRSELFRQANDLGVPAQYVIVQPPTSNRWFAPSTFDLDESPGTLFMDIFSYVRGLSSQDMALPEIAGFLARLDVPRTDIVPVWIHAMGDLVVEQDIDDVLAVVETYSLTTVHETMEGYYQDYYTRWLPTFEQNRRHDEAEYAQLVLNGDRLAALDPIENGGLVVDSNVVTYEYPVPDQIDPIPDLFNDVSTSYVVPFAQYNIDVVKENDEETVRYYKIYKGETKEQRPDYNNVVIPSDRALLPNTLYVNVWQGSGSRANAKSAAKGHFTAVEVSLIPDETPRVVGGPSRPARQSRVVRVRFSSPQTDAVDERTILSRLHTHVPMLPVPGSAPVDSVLTGDASPAKELSVTGHVTFYDSTVRPVAILETITNDPLFSTFLYVEEGMKPFSEKDRFVIYFRGIDINAADHRPIVSATLREHAVQEGDTYTVNGEPVVADSTFSAVVVHVTKAVSRRAATQFAEIVARMFERLRTDTDDILDEYQRMVPELVPVIEDEENRTAQILHGASTYGVDSATRNLETLQSIAGDIFYYEWARDCQPPVRHVWPINRSEVDEWKKTRQVLEFPKNDPQVLLVCPDDEWKHPGVRVNHRGNRGKYPVRPCCFKPDELARPNSELNRYLSGKPVVAQPKSMHVIKTEKILTPGRLGTVNSVLASFVNDRLPYSLYRLGVPRSTNSAIHCLAIATGVESYLDADDREEWAREFRKTLFEQLDPETIRPLQPAALRQSMYDADDATIVKQATDNELFFDPYLFIRALEILFDCVIYVFERSDVDRSTGKKTSLMRLFRHKYFVSRPPEPRKPVVLLTRFLGAERDMLTYPQCELVVDRGENELLTYQFGDDMDDLMAPAFQYVARTLSWSIDDANEIEPEVVSRLDAYSRVNVTALFSPVEIESQYVDTAGKARVFWLSNGVIAATPPTAPVNAPAFDPRGAAAHVPPVDSVVRTFGVPTAVSRAAGTRRPVNGLWYAAGDVRLFLYCPCQETTAKSLARYAVEPAPALIPRDDKASMPLFRLQHLERAASFLVQLVKYLFLLADRPDDTDEFLASATALLDEPPDDSLDVYDPRELPRLLPRGTMTDVLANLSSTSWVEDGRLVVYDESLLDSLAYHVDRFRDSVAGLDVDPLGFSQLANYYGNKTLFAINPSTETILGSLNEYHRWLDVFVPSASLVQRTIQNLNASTQTTLNPNAFSYQDPYLFGVTQNLDPRDDVYYVVQNVAGGELRRAAAVALAWHETFFNPGFTADPITGDLPAHVVYRISPSGGLQLAEGVPDPASLQVLTYGNDMHAALLPILN